MGNASSGVRRTKAGSKGNSSDALSHRDTVIPANVVSAFKTVFNWCNVYGAEGVDQIALLNVEGTPGRIARMYKEELLASYKPGAKAALLKHFTTFESPLIPQEMVILKDIPFYSLCAHPLVPFMGTASVGYIPGKKLAGLSKLARVVKYYSQMLQLQERLTANVADFLYEELGAQGVIVITDAEHLCMAMRGVKTPGVQTRTAAIRGLASNDASVLAEFYRLLTI